jgi:hypothetical protein
LFIVCTALTVLVLADLLWGVNYHTDSFKDMSGMRDEPVSTDDLAAVTEYFAENLAASSGGVTRDANGVFAVSRDKIIDESPDIYASVTGEFPFLAMKDHRVKPFHFSHLMSLVDFTGFYFPPDRRGKPEYREPRVPASRHRGARDGAPARPCPPSRSATSSPCS